MRFSRALSGAALVFAAVWHFPCQAAVVQLAPIPVEVSWPQAAGILSLTNKATADVALQVRVFKWTQAEGEDVLTPTEEVVVSPPIAAVPAGQTLSVRLVRVAKTPVTREETFRVWVDELPSGNAKAKATQLRILTRYSVPAFFEPEDASGSEPKLSWSLRRSEHGARLVASNPGGRRVRISGVQLRVPDGKQTAFKPGSEPSGYALAGQYIAWNFESPAGFPLLAGVQYKLAYETEGQLHHDTVSLQEK